MDDLSSTWQLKAKYRGETPPRFELLCYSDGRGQYLSRITDSEGNHVVTISNYDCTPKKDKDPTEAINVVVDRMDQVEGRDFVFVRSDEGWYSICRKFKLKDLILRYDHGALNAWKQVGLC